MPRPVDWTGLSICSLSIEPSLADLLGSMSPEFFNAPVVVVEADGLAQGLPQVCQVLVDPALQHLFLQGPFQKRSTTPLVSGSPTTDGYLT